MAVTAVSGADVRRPVPRLRRLEDERWLALALLLPTAVLLGLFIAYPFIEGVLLSMTSQRVGVPGAITVTEDVDPRRQIRRVRDEGEARRDDGHLHDERGKRPTARERDVEANEDKQERPEACHGEP